MKKGQMLGTALRIATNAHDGQYDKGGQPYVLHVLKVMHYTKTQDEELQCVAVLHDVVEDTSITWLDLKNAGISDRVIKAVKALTKIPGQTYEEYKASVLSNVDAMHVKLADLRHNSDIRRLKGVTERDRDRMNRYHNFSIDIKEQLERIV